MQVFSPAKVNLFLHIKHLREDEYHEIDSVFAKLDFGDILDFEEKKEGIEIRASGKYKIPTNADNLVYKAADIMRARAKGKRGIKIHIEKNIPVGSGLGGGSSNAATTLKYLNEAWDIHLPQNELMILGESLGADVPFFLSDFSVARVGGVGEKVIPIKGDIFLQNKLWHKISPSPSLEKRGVAEYSSLEKRGVAECSSSARKVEEKGFPLFKGGVGGISRRDTENDIIILIIPKYISIGSAWAFVELRKFYNEKYPQYKSITNTFEEVIFQKYPDLLTIKQLLIESGAKYASLSGSGSTVFGVFEEGGDIEKINKAIGDKGEVIRCKLFVKPECHPSRSSG
ncbi:4-(cytidine 5'-diphospho)-2-C-methyl-D-erythritol kinase [Candidatus Peregrinibacteria bacterium]|jgi:4-diphosphocytidyl-2C-methyl-D-erythritol kinase|nr:4-(cytidine 5'-diphospho)-2-C-methyl-D-erythritol kinase [Candidatus Peregrinibacteria bacterium]